MGYVVPSLAELPDPTLEEYNADPDYYIGKLREYEATPYWCRHFGISKWLVRFFVR